MESKFGGGAGAKFINWHAWLHYFTLRLRLKTNYALAHGNA